MPTDDHADSPAPADPAPVASDCPLAEAAGLILVAAEALAAEWAGYALRAARSRSRRCPWLAQDYESAALFALWRACLGYRPGDWYDDYDPDDPAQGRRIFRAWLLKNLDTQFARAEDRDGSERRRIDRKARFPRPERTNPVNEVDGRDLWETRAGRLTPLQREVVVDHYYFGKRVGEIARERRMAASNVCSCLNRAVARLRPDGRRCEDTHDDR